VNSHSATEVVELKRPSPSKLLGIYISYCDFSDFINTNYPPVTEPNMVLRVRAKDSILINFGV
jgi:hypothetical protein